MKTDPALFTRIGLAVLAHLGRPSQSGYPAQALDIVVPTGAVILVTSARAGEGKSFVAYGLARALADQQDADVLWVDAAFDTTPAVADMARDAAGFADVVTQGSLDGIGFAGGGDRLQRLGRGTHAPSPLLYRPEGVRKGLAALRAGFALTVIDAPSLEDCGALLAEVDACVMVVDARHTSKHAAQHALAASSIEPGRLAGVVLNHRPRPIPRWLGGE
jgi:MinD-like ATPase involved in chromosome partitioning or flagellar assembly